MNLNQEALAKAKAAPFRKHTIGETISDDAVEIIITAYIEALPHVDRAGVLEEAAIEEMRTKWRENPAMPAYQRLVFDGICDMTIASLRALAQPAVNTSPEGVGGTHIGIKEAIELSLGGLPPAQIENLHFFRNDAPAPYDSPAVKAMARELLAFRKICFDPLPNR